MWPLLYKDGFYNLVASDLVWSVRGSVESLGYEVHVISPLKGGFY